MRQRSKQANAERRLPQETIDDFRRLGLTRCLQPAMFGGFGSDYRVFSKMLRALAQGCGSSAWVAAVHGEHSWVVGNFPEAAQHDVWDNNPHAVASASLRAERHRRASGRRSSAERPWGFASGCDYAQWILLTPRLKDGGTPEARMFLVPIERGRDHRRLGRHGTVRHRQQVDRGQGSDGPGRPTRSACANSRPAPRRAPPCIAGNPLYRTPRNLLALFSLSSVNVGLAERAVAEFVAIHPRARQSRGSRVADLEAMQIDGVEASAQAERRR